MKAYEIDPDAFPNDKKKAKKALMLMQKAEI